MICSRCSTVDSIPFLLRSSMILHLLQALHLHETSMTWGDISAIAVITPLLAVHPREEHVPSKLVGISTASVERAKFCSLIVKSRACDAAFLKFSSHNMNTFSLKTFKCSVKRDFATGEDKPKTLQSFSSPVRPLPITLMPKHFFS